MSCFPSPSSSASLRASASETSLPPPAARACGWAASPRSIPPSGVLSHRSRQVLAGLWSLKLDFPGFLFYVILSGAPAGKWNDFVAISNIYGGAGHFPLLSVALIEVVLTALFLVVIVGVTSKKAPAGFAPIAIGLTLVFIHLAAIPVSTASVNR